MVRSAAKNHARVTVVCDPRDYERVLDELAQRRRHDARDDAARARRQGVRAHRARTTRRSAGTSPRAARTATRATLPALPHAAVRARLRTALRREPAPGGALLRRARRARRDRSRGRRASARAARSSRFNNLVDVDAALEAVREFDGPAAVVVKHTNPCGVAVAGVARSRPTARRARPTRSAPSAASSR